MTVVLTAGDVVHFTPCVGDLGLTPAVLRPCQSALVLNSHDCSDPGCLVLLVDGATPGLMPVERVAPPSPTGGPALGCWHLGAAA